MTDEILLEAIEKMDRAVEHARSQFTTVRTGRATPALVEKLMVEYYGADVPLQQLAGFQVPEARMLVVKPHDRGALPPSNGPSATPTWASRRPMTEPSFD